MYDCDRFHVYHIKNYRRIKDNRIGFGVGLSAKYNNEISLSDRDWFRSIPTKYYTI